MQFDYVRPTPPSEDKRWKVVGATMRRAGSGPSALIETLHTLQDSFGYLDRVGLAYVAASLRVPLSKVFGVATFYHHFQLAPPGVHRCVVCTGTACHLQGAPAILEGIRDRMGIEPGQTSPDGQVSLLTARCLGSCGLAPVVVLDGAVEGRLAPEAVFERVAGWGGGS